MTHLYTILTGGDVHRGPGQPHATAIVVAADTVLLVGTDEEAAAISRGDSLAVDLAGAEILATGDLEPGSPADFDVVHRDGAARIRGGRLVEGTLAGWHDHAADTGHHGP